MEQFVVENRATSGFVWIKLWLLFTWFDFCCEKIIIMQPNYRVCGKLWCQHKSQLCILRKIWAQLKLTFASLPVQTTSGRWLELHHCHAQKWLKTCTGLRQLAHLSCALWKHNSLNHIYLHRVENVHFQWNYFWEIQECILSNGHQHILWWVDTYTM